MRSWKFTLALTATVILAAACQNTPTATSSNASPNTPAGATAPAPSATSAQAAAMTPEQLGSLGAAIKKQPNDAHRLLTEKGLDEQSFASAIRKVSQDPAAAKRYAAAYKSAS